jgi:hypothetical protein
VAYLFFAVIDDQHDVKNPLTVVRVSNCARPHGDSRLDDRGAGVRTANLDRRVLDILSEHGATQLNDHAAWVGSKMLHRIVAGEVPYRVQPITRKAAARIRKRRERTMDFHYSILVRADDPTDTPYAVLREWDPAGTGWGYTETYTREGEWEHDPVRLDFERSGEDRTRIVPSDSSTVHQFIESRHRKLGLDRKRAG